MIRNSGMTEKKHWWPKRRIYYWGSWRRAYHWGLKEVPITEKTKEDLITEKPKENPKRSFRSFTTLNDFCIAKNFFFFFLVMVYDKVGDGERDVKRPYLAHFCAEKNHTKISYEYSAIKRWLRCQNIPRIQKISYVRTIKNRWLRTKVAQFAQTKII